MTKLSVNINKIATLRNARGGNVPDLLKVATDIQNLADKELLYILVLMSATFAIKMLAI
jgi:pyridoxine 5'-phosphate synthase PdxJ